MESTSKRVHQLVQPAVKQKCSTLLQSPKYHSRNIIAMNLDQIMTLAKRNILPSVHQQLWALEAALVLKSIEAIDTIKAHYSLIPQMYNSCIDNIQSTSDKRMQRTAAKFMQFLDSKGITQQHLDIKGKTVNQIINMWVPVDEDSTFELTALAQKGDFQGCQRLLSRGRIRIDLASCIDSETISLKMVQFLVEQPVINVNEMFGQSPLVQAALRGNVDMVKLLLEQPGIDINRWHNMAGSPLIRASIIGELEVIKCLLKRSEIDVNFAPFRGNTAIIYAMQHRHMDIVKLLANHPDIDPNVSRYLDYKPFIMMACQANDLEIMDWLLRFPEIEINMTDCNGHTAFHHAVADRHLEIVERLLQHPSIDVNLVDKSGYTAFMYACKSGCVDVVKLLLSHPGVDINHVDNNGSTALILAAEYGHFRLVEFLLTHPGINVDHENKRGYAKSGARINHRNKQGNTALMMAIECGPVNMVEMLLEQPRINVYQPNTIGDTALILAAKRSEFSHILQLLLAHRKVNVNHKNKGGDTALTKARKYGCEDNVQTLLKHLKRQKLI